MQLLSDETFNGSRSRTERVHPLNQEHDEISLTGVPSWPVELAEKLLANPQPWGPPGYALGLGYIDDPNQPDQSSDFYELARCVRGAYTRHGGDMGEAWNWARPLLNAVEEGKTCAHYTTQDLCDILFLHYRGERFCDHLIRSAEPVLREIVREIVQRVHASQPPVSGN
jgi:hypothetical protein